MQFGSSIPLLLLVTLGIVNCQQQPQTNDSMSNPIVFAELFSNGTLVGAEAFIGDIQLARENTTASTGIDGTALLHLDDLAGCSVNKTIKFPNTTAQNILMVSTGGCSIDQKVDTALDLGATTLLVYSTDDSPIDNTGPSQFKPISILFVPAKFGEQLRIAGKYVSQDPENRRLHLKISQFDQLPNIWEMTLLAMIILLGLAFIISLVLHFRLYWMRRQIMDAGGTGGNNLEAGQAGARRRHSRITMSIEDLQTQFPVIIYSADKFKSASGKDISEATLLSQTESPASVEAIQELPAVNSDLCAICIEEFEEGDSIRQLTCQHLFHRDCIDPWLTKRNAVCPVCKRILQHPSPVEIYSLAMMTEISNNSAADLTNSSETITAGAETTTISPQAVANRQSDNSQSHWIRRLRARMLSTSRSSVDLPIPMSQVT